MDGPWESTFAFRPCGAGLAGFPVPHTIGTQEAHP